MDLERETRRAKEKALLSVLIPSRQKPETLNLVVLSRE